MVLSIITGGENFGGPAGALQSLRHWDGFNNSGGARRKRAGCLAVEIDPPPGVAEID